jgi:hypothetical protein
MMSDPYQQAPYNPTQSSWQQQQYSQQQNARYVSYPQSPDPQGRRNTYIIVVAIIASIAVIAFGVVGVMLIKKSKHGGSGGATGASASSRVSTGTRTLNKQIYDSGMYRLSLVSIEVKAQEIKINTVYKNYSSVAQYFTCPTAEKDPEYSSVALSDGQTVKPSDSFCAAEHPGENLTLQGNASIDGWMVFPVVPAPGTSFTLNWYNFPAVAGLTL